MTSKRCRGAARILGVVASLLVAAAPAPARAESPADVENARALFVEAARRGHEGRWNEARELYARSLQLKAAPVTRYSLGVAQQQCGHLAEALASFRTFVGEPATPASAPYVEAARAAIAELAGQVGRVIVTVGPEPVAELSLTIDGQPVPPAWDGPRELDPGAHSVMARAPGFRSTSAYFHLAAGGSETVTLQLAPLPNGTRVEALRTPPVASPAPATPPPPPPTTAIPPPGGLPIALMSAGGSTFVVGLVLGLVGVTQAGQAPTRDGADAGGARAKAIAGDVLAATGAATAGAGLVVFLVRRGSPVSAAPFVAPRAGGLAGGFALRF